MLRAPGLIAAILLCALCPWPCAGQVGRPLTGAQLRELQRHKAEAEIDYGAGRLEQAVDHWQLAYQIDPDPVLLASLGLAYARLGQVPRALEHYERALSHRPPLPPDIRARLLHPLQRALQSAEAQADRQPAPLLLAIGRGYDLLGQQERALDLYEQYLRREPDPPLLERQRAERYLTEACAALAAQPPTGPRLLRLGRGYDRLGQVRSALRLYVAALGSGNLPPDMAALARAYIEDACRRLPGPCQADFSGEADPRLMRFWGDLHSERGQGRRAVPYYARYLRDVPAQDPGRREVRALLQRTCEALLREGRDVPAPCAVPGGAAPAERKKSGRAWLWAGLAVLAAGGATALGLGLGLPRPEPPPPPPGDLIVLVPVTP
jgi:tetratricopeptide (TPR) repeat protein